MCLAKYTGISEVTLGMEAVNVEEVQDSNERPRRPSPGIRTDPTEKASIEWILPKFIDF